MNYKQHTECRVCGNRDLKMYLCLGDMPLSNNLGAHMYDPIHDQKYPLQLMFCEQCGLSQLSIVVAPEILFSNYVYRSSISKGFVTHCLEMAKYLRRKYKLDENSVHIDIAGNDGALLEQFRNELDHIILNVDPALNLNAICQAARIPTLSEFWGIRAAHMILNGGLLHRGSGSKSKDRSPRVTGADLITATNVFAHVDNVREFLQAVRVVLKRTGVLVLEFPYLIDFLEKNEFDTIYFEHLSYFSIYPLTLLCDQVGLNVMSVSKQEIHGGSVRVEIGYGPQDDTVAPFVMNERQHYSKLERHQQFAEDVQVSILNFKNKMLEINGTIAGFAASAKGNTLLNSVWTTAARLRYIVDETPEKIGRWSPGVRIPIVSLHDMMRTPPDYLVILSWNFATEIMKKCRSVGYQGKFILPIPEFKVLDGMA